MSGGAGFPSASAGGLPSMSSGGLPAMGVGLPMSSGGGLPMTAGGGGSSHDPFSSVSGAGLSMPHQTGELGFGQDAALGGSNEPGGVGIGSVDVGAIGGIGGEVELEGSLPAGVGGTLLQLPKPTRSASAEASDDTPAKASKLKLVAGVGVAAILLGGLALSATSLGPFGIYAISDTLSGSSYDANLVSLVEEVTTSLDADTHAAAVQAIDRARAVQASQKRHAKTAAYAAYVVHAKSVRFGRDSAAEAQAKSLLESVDRSVELRELALALAAEAAVEGELARAREQLGRVQASHAEDIDAAVLAGEVELLAKAPDAAIAAFTKAIALHKSPRTLFGLARAQLAAGKPAEAEVTAKSVLDSSKGHVSARTMLASIAATTPEREKEALGHLEAVTQDAAVRANASSSELVEVYVQLGRVHLMGSRVSQAQEAYGEALKLNPQAVDALVGSGELFYRAGRFSEAEARFESALRADADNVDAKVGTAKTWLRLERQKDAKDLLKKLKEAHPTEARVPYWLARVEESMGTRKEAEALYKEAIQKATSSDTAVPPYVALANLLTSVGRPSDASKALREAAEKFPDSPDLSRARGDVALQTGNYEQALEQYSAALKKGEDLGTLFSLGVTLRRMRQFDQAVQVFDKVAKVDKDYPGLALERGLYYEETGQSDLALQMYAEALQKAPNDIDLKLRIGSTLVAAGQSKQAEPSLKEVIRERPNSAEANHFLGRAMLLSSSNLNEAMRFLQRAVDLDGNRAEYFLYVGWAANEAGQPARADAALAKSLELDSSLGDAYWQRGILLQKQGATLDAIADLNRALELRPSRYEAHATLALCYEDQSAWAKAEESWRKALKGNDTQPDWQYRLAKVLKRKADAKGSLEAMERAVELAENRDPRPGWIADAHFVLGDAYKATDKDKAIQHFSEFLRLSTPDNAYRVDAERALATLKPR
jgi:tetratricopeptide (TPR) repeat protein